MLELSWGNFLVLLTLAFIVLNTIFATLYLLIGVEHIGVKPSFLIKDFFNAFFFSVQTVTSVGYGLFSPTKFLTGLISSIEAFVGLVSFAFVTGLLYGRFSKPKSNIRFTKYLLTSNYKDQKALMFRILNRRKSMVVMPKVKASISISEKDEKGEYQNSFYELKLERKQITYLPTTWTLVHPIDKDSPLKKYSVKELSELHLEVLILLSYHDESFNEVLHQAHSYTTDDLKIGYKFKKAFGFNEDGKVELDHNLFDIIEKEIK